MRTEFRDDASVGRFELRADGEIAVVLTYERSGDVLVLRHVETDPRLRGQGLAAALVTHVLSGARANGEQVLPVCPYIRDFIAERLDTYGDMVPARRRAEFGLDG